MDMSADDWALIASVVSTVVGILAIGLSITFYRLSSFASMHIADSAKEISVSTRTLEKLFDSLNSGMFGIVRDTMTDMRRSLWPSSQGDRADEIMRATSDNSLGRVRQQVDERLTAIASDVSLNAAEGRALFEQIRALANDAIELSSSATREARRDAVEQLVREWVERRGALLASDLVAQGAAEGLSFREVIDALLGLLRSDALRASELPIAPHTRISTGANPE